MKPNSVWKKDMLLRLYFDTNSFVWCLNKKASKKYFTYRIGDSIRILSVRLNHNSGHIFTTTRRDARLKTPNTLFHKVTISCWFKFTEHSHAYL